MSIWKQLSQQGVWKSLDQHDVYISTYVAKKRYIITGTDLINNGIVFVPYGEAPAIPTSPTPTPTPTKSPTPSVTPSPSLTPSISPTPSVTPSKSPS
tara:strand:+ start:142 stop:432 length:291 start_codon:yes stop_codon:yes gene_type:complete